MRLLRLALILCTSFTSAPIYGAIVFNGYANALPGVLGSAVGGDWSSDFGADFRAFPSGVGNIGGTTTPTAWPDRSFHSDESLTIDVQRVMFPSAAGYLQPRGVFDIGPSGVVSPDVVHRYRIDSILFNPAVGIGIGTAGFLIERLTFPAYRLLASFTGLRPGRLTS